LVDEREDVHEAAEADAAAFVEQCGRPFYFLRRQVVIQSLKKAQESHLIYFLINSMSAEHILQIIIYLQNLINIEVLFCSKGRHHDFHLAVGGPMILKIDLMLILQSYVKYVFIERALNLIGLNLHEFPLRNRLIARVPVSPPLRHIIHFVLLSLLLSGC